MVGLGYIFNSCIFFLKVFVTKQLNLLLKISPFKNRFSAGILSELYGMSEPILGHILPSKKSGEKFKYNDEEKREILESLSLMQDKLYLTWDNNPNKVIDAL